MDVTLHLEQSIIDEALKRSRDAARAIPDLLDAARRLLGPNGFAIHSVIGRGGNGVVFFATDERLGREVAIKAMLPGSEGSTEHQAAFMREARFLARFTHENIVQVFDVVQHGGLMFLVMEYVRGESLTALVARRGRLPEAEALRLAVGVLRGVEVAHRAGILHRDIKPENILLGADGVPKVADFGLAAHRPEVLLDVGSVIGTPSFMAPEQALGRICTPRTDLYSVGLCLYFMLTGRRPHSDAGSPEEIIRRAAEGALEPAVALRPDLSRAAQEALAGALAVDPIQRFLDAQAFREACERALLAGGYTKPVARRWKALARAAVPILVILLAIALGFAASTTSERSRRADMLRQLEPVVAETLGSLDAAAFAEHQAGRETTELIALRTSLEAASKSADAADVADLLSRSRVLLLSAEIRRLASMTDTGLDDGARRQIEDAFKRGDPAELRRLRATLLYAPERLRPPDGGSP